MLPTASEIIVEAPDRDVNLIIVYNPFDVTDQAREKLVWNDGKTLADYLDGLPTNVRWAVTLNAEIIEPERFADVTPEADDYIVLVPVPLGGSGGGKTVIRMVALLAIAIVAPYAGAAAGGAMFGAGTVAASVAGGIVAGTIGNAGSLSVNAMLPPVRS